MAQISNPNLNLTFPDVSNVTINVTYNAGINPLERHLGANGLILRERIAVIGVDPPGGTTGALLHNFPAQDLPVTAGGGSQTLARNRSMTVTRASLQEDAGIDSDEIRCRIVIEPLNLPLTIFAFTNQEILFG